MHELDNEPHAMSEAPFFSVASCRNHHLSIRIAETQPRRSAELIRSRWLKCPHFSSRLTARNRLPSRQTSRRMTLRDFRSTAVIPKLISRLRPPRRSTLGLYTLPLAIKSCRAGLIAALSTDMQRSNNMPSCRLYHGYCSASSWRQWTRSDVTSTTKTLNFNFAEWRIEAKMDLYCIVVTSWYCVLHRKLAANYQQFWHCESAVEW